MKRETKGLLISFFSSKGTYSWWMIFLRAYKRRSKNAAGLCWDSFIRTRRPYHIPEDELEFPIFQSSVACWGHCIFRFLNKNVLCFYPPLDGNPVSPSFILEGSWAWGEWCDMEGSISLESFHWIIDLLCASLPSRAVPLSHCITSHWTPPCFISHIWTMRVQTLTEGFGQKLLSWSSTSDT